MPDMSLLGRATRGAATAYRRWRPAGWPHDFSGAFGRETRALWGSCRGVTGPYPCALAAAWLGPLRNVGGPRRWEPGFLGASCGAAAAVVPVAEIVVQPPVVAAATHTFAACIDNNCNTLLGVLVG